MEWVCPGRTGPLWKQGWKGQTLSSVSAPPLPLLTLFGVVIFLLWLSQYTGYKAQLHQTAINFQLFLLVLPILLIFFMILFSSSGRFGFWQRRPEPHKTVHRYGVSPWVIAMLLGVLFVLLSYQSSFHSIWFGPLWRPS